MRTSVFFLVVFLLVTACSSAPTLPTTQSAVASPVLPDDAAQASSEPSTPTSSPEPTATLTPTPPPASGWTGSYEYLAYTPAAPDDFEALDAEFNLLGQDGWRLTSPLALDMYFFIREQGNSDHWEYKTLVYQDDAGIIQMGQDGWELVDFMAMGIYYFKRPVGGPVTEHEYQYLAESYQDGIETSAGLTLLGQDGWQLITLHTRLMYDTTAYGIFERPTGRAAGNWEYLYHYIDYNLTADELTRLGQEGWEAVCITGGELTGYNHEDAYYDYVFRRVEDPTMWEYTSITIPVDGSDALNTAMAPLGEEGWILVDGVGVGGRMFLFFKRDGTSPAIIPTATVTPLPPTVTPTLPEGLPAWLITPTPYMACEGNLPTRLWIGGYAYVSTDTPDSNRVRSGPGTDYTHLGNIDPGEAMEVLDGPVCADGYVWWQVRALMADLTGWTVESADSYWLVPCPPESECGPMPENP